MPKSFLWDHYSDQPHVLKREEKNALRKGHGWEYIKLVMTNLFYFPYLFLKFLFQKKRVARETVPHSFYGLCVNLDKGEEQYALVEALGVTSLEIRFFLHDMANIDAYVTFAKKFGDDKEILITIIQDRTHIEESVLLKKDMKEVFSKFQDVAQEFQIGNAINRIKWGFVSMEEYLTFYQNVQEVRDEAFPKLTLIGPAVIDFEYHFTIRALFNGFKIHYDKVSALLYVDRRGSPENRQLGIFDLKNKISFLETIVNSAQKANDPIYISEVNWPLSNTAPYAPTSEKECVSETLYTKYMLAYFETAKQSLAIEKVFWHQLIAPGYGLVDNRDNSVCKTEAFYAFKTMLEENKK